jgi:ABC-2 type transport system ATP-binding protein
MSLEVVGLTKIFGAQKALDNISFTAETGQITGFLGPNGAGKSTTMKIATGYSTPTSGTVMVDGIDVLQDPLKVKQITGYLPEHNPLYLEMYVREFLQFVGRAYGVKNLKGRVEEMIELIGLTRESNKKIGTLSKGYRQRVGLAQTMIHNPSVLILDEPTTGLDPNQIIEIRNVIKEVAKDRTVILSTHIMQEVEAICDKVVIIDQGIIVADADVKSLKLGEATHEAYRMKFESTIDSKAFDGYDLEKVSDTEYLIRSEGKNTRSELMRIISDKELPLSSINKSEEQSLEEVFRKLTKAKKD